MSAAVLHTCSKGTCASCRGCAGKRAPHFIPSVTGALTVERCGHCDGPQAHRVGALAPAPAAERTCTGRFGTGHGTHDPHVIGRPAS